MFEKLISLVKAKAAHISDFVGYTAASRVVGVNNIKVALA